MKKINLITAFSVFSLLVSAQDLSISPSITDVADDNQFNYRVEGSVVIEPGTEFIVELYDPSQNVLFSGYYSFDTPYSSTIPEFMYNASENHYSMNLGNYETDKNLIKVWTVKNGGVVSELTYQK